MEGKCGRELRGRNNQKDPEISVPIELKVEKCKNFRMWGKSES